MCDDKGTAVASIFGGRAGAIFGGDGAPFGGGGSPFGGNFKLKKKRENRLCEAIPDDASQCKLSPQARMRNVDTLRLHKPAKEERQAFNIPEYVERVDVHQLKDVLVACGGTRGVRFSSLDLKDTSSIIHQLKCQFISVEDCFKNLSGAAKKFKRGPDSTAESSAEVEATAYHQKAARYLELYEHFAKIVRRKRSEVAKDAIHDPADNADEIADDTSKASQPFPRFICVLIEKYKKDVLENEGNSFNSQPATIDSMERFVSFLCFCMQEDSCLTADEAMAFEELMQASKAKSTFMNETLGQVKRYTGRQLSLQFWDFLKSVRELKTIPKNKKKLESSMRERFLTPIA